MINPPKTKEEARNNTYGGNKATGSPSKPYDPTCCAYEVSEPGRGFFNSQCKRKPGFGAGKLYCTQHAKQVPAENEGETKWIVSVSRSFDSISIAQATVLGITDATVTVGDYKRIYGNSWLNSGRNNLSTSDTTLVVCDSLQEAKHTAVTMMQRKKELKQQGIARIEDEMERVTKL